MMKTSSILLIVIALATFALFFRLYQGKLNKLQNREDFQCKPKIGMSRVTDRIDKTMRIYVNSSDPIVKGGVEKFTKSSHVKPMLKDLKNMLSLYLSKYCNFKVELLPETEENGIPVVNVSITDGEAREEPEGFKDFNNGATGANNAAGANNAGANNAGANNATGANNAGANNAGDENTVIKDFFKPIDYGENPHDCSDNINRPKTEEKKLPGSLGMGVKLGYEFKIEDQGQGNDTMGQMTLKNITTGKEHFLHEEKGRGAKTYSGEVTITPFVNPGDTIQLLFTESKCDQGHVMKWHFMKNLNLIIIGEEDALLEDEENEEEYDEISLPYDDQIKKFCYDRDDCPYFFIDFNIKITEKTIELLSYFSLKKINDDEDFLNLVELIGRGRKYNNVQVGMFKVIHLARTFLFSRKYSEVDINAKCLQENFVSNTSIGETLNKELVTSEFDASTLIEEYYSQQGQNLLFIKENIRNNLLSNCKDDKLKQYLIDNKNTMDLVTNLDDNANLLKSMLNMSGDYSGENDKETNKMASKWSEFHSIYKSQLEDMLIDKFKISDPDHRIERDTHKYRINKYSRELEKIKMLKNPNKRNFDKFYRNQQVSLQSQNDGTVLNYSRVSEKGKFVDKYLIFANGGCLKNLGGKLVIEYDYNFQRNNPNLHFNLEIIENPKDYIAKMNYTFVDERRNRNFKMNEVPSVLISPIGMYGKVIKIENEKIYLENCDGKLNERFRFRDLIESPCDFPEKEVN